MDLLEQVVCSNLFKNVLMFINVREIERSYDC